MIFAKIEVRKQRRKILHLTGSDKWMSLAAVHKVMATPH